MSEERVNDEHAWKIVPELFRRYRLMLITVCLWGIAAHGYMMFHKISFHDDAVSSFYLGGTYGMGRWMLGICGKVLNLLGGNYSLPLFNGLMSILLIGFAGCVLIDMFGLKKSSTCVALGGIMVTIPAIASLFGYMFTSFPYMFGMFLSVAGAYTICHAKRMRRWVSLAIGSGMICLAVGIYQPYFAVAAALVLLYMIVENLKETEKSFGAFIKEAMYNLASLLLSLILYFALNKFFLWFLQMELYDYQGVSNFGIVSFSDYIDRICLAYGEFFVPSNLAVHSVYPQVMRYVYWIILLMIAVLLSGRLWKIFRQNVGRGIQCLILLLLFPLAVNLIFVLADISSIYALTMYGQIVLFVFFVWLLENTKGKKAKPVLYMQRLGLLLLIFMCIWFCRYDNTCYLKMDYLQNRAIGYFNTLITRIESIEGYRDEMPVTFVNEMDKKNENLEITEEFRNITIMPYHEDSLINNYAWLDFVKQWCGYEPFLIDGSLYENFEVVKSMPCYPDDGSIQIVEGVIVVKF